MVISHHDNGHWAAYLELPLLCSKIDSISILWGSNLDGRNLFISIIARIIVLAVDNISCGFFYTWRANNMSHRFMSGCNWHISEPGSQSVGLAWVCFVGICRHCRGFPMHWLWNQFYPNWICQSQSKVEGNTIQHCQFYKPGLLEGKVLLKVKCAFLCHPMES